MRSDRVGYPPRLGGAPGDVRGEGRLVPPESGEGGWERIVYITFLIMSYVSVAIFSIGRSFGGYGGSDDGDDLRLGRLRKPGLHVGVHARVVEIFGRPPPQVDHLRLSVDEVLRQLGSRALFVLDGPVEVGDRVVDVPDLGEDGPAQVLVEIDRRSPLEDADIDVGSCGGISAGRGGWGSGAAHGSLAWKCRRCPWSRARCLMPDADGRVLGVRAWRPILSWFLNSENS